MDPSYVNHHHHNNHSRYVPFSLPPLQPPPPSSHHHPPLPPPPSYQQSPNNLYVSRHHLPPPQAPPQLRPLPTLPPRPPQQQQQQPYHPIPAPPPPLLRQQLPSHHPYNPHHSQYTHNTNTNFNSNSNPNNVSYQFRDFPQRRVPVLDTHLDYLSDNQVSRPRLVSNLEREVHYHQFDRRPASPGIDRFRHDLEGSSRFRDPEHNQREREAFGRVHSDRWISDRASRDFGIVSMGSESNPNDSGFDYEVTENMRRGLRLRDQLIDNGNNAINERDEMRVFSRKNDYHYDKETEVFTEREGSREGSHELNRTPRKQIRKKSALLRIQKAKPNHRSTGDERSHFSGYYNEGKTSTFRGKDLVLHSDHAMEEKEREGSPVELDVSFKSNSLVAKAIMTPSSAPISDSNVMPRNTKIRRFMLFNKGCSSLQPNNASESGAKLDGSTYVVNSGSCSKDSKKSEGKVKTSSIGNVQDGIAMSCSKGTNVSFRKGKLKKSPKLTVKFDDSSSVTVTQDAPISDKKPEPLEGKVTIPCVSSMVDGGAQTCSDRANVSAGENKVEGALKSTVSDKAGANVGKPSSIKATKKKRIMRKVVKKVTNSPLNLENSGSAKKGDQPVKADTSTRLSSTSVADKSDTPLQMKIASADVRSVHGVVSECCLKESAILLENEKLNGASKKVVSKEVGTLVDPISSVTPKIKRKRKSLTSLSSSGHEDAKADQGSVNADNSVHGLHIISNVKEDATETPNESITSETHIVEDLNKQFYHNESNINFRLSKSEEMQVHGGVVDIGSSSFAMHSFTGFDCGSSNTQEIDIASDNVNSGSEQVCATPGSSVVQDGSTGGFPEANYSVGRNNLPYLPCAKETQINSGSIHADCSNHNSSAICIPDIGYINSGESNCEIGDAFVKHPSSPTLSLGNYGTEAIPNAAESLQCRDEYAANVHQREVAIAELDLSSSAFPNISIGSTDALTSANCLDTTLCTSSINPNPAEAMVSGIQWLDVGLQHSRDKVSILHRRNSKDTFPEVSASADGKSPEKKKRKIATSSSSVTESVISQGVAVSDISKSALQLPSNFSDDLLQLEMEVKKSSKDGLHTEGTGLLLVNSSVGGPSQAVGSFRDAYSDDRPSIDLSLTFVESVAPSSSGFHLLKLGGEKLSTAQPLPSVNNSQIDAMDIEGDDRVKVHDTAEDLKIISSEVTQCKITPEHNSVSLDQRLPSTEEENDNHLPLKDYLPSASNSLVFGVDAKEVSATFSNGEAMSAPDIQSDVGSHNNHDNLVISTSTCKVPFCQKSDEKPCGDEKLSDDILMTEGACNSSAIVSYSQHSKTILKSNDVIQTNRSIAGKAGLLPSHDSKNTDSLNSVSGETHGRKNPLSHVVPKSYPTSSSFVFPASKNTTSSTKITKPRTWHRTDNSSASLLSGTKPSSSANPLQKQMPKKSAYFQSTSYIRKGNSLFRKPVSVPALPQGSHSLSSSVNRLNSGVVDEVSKDTVPDSRAEAVDLRTGGANTSFKSPTTSPLSSVTKVPNHASNSSGECPSPPLAEPSISDCCETTTGHPSCMEINDVLNSPEEELSTSETLNRNGSVGNLEDWTEQNEGDLVPSNANRVTYVKLKSNQLIATSDCGHTSILNADKNHSASSGGYYKKSKNQLVRTALENQIKQVVSMSDDISNSVGQVAAKAISSRTFGKRRSNKVVAKTHKPSKFSLVWTPHSARLSNNDGNSLHHPKVLPHLFPWKRITYKGSFKLNSVSSCNSSLSTIGRRMLLLRKRNTVYTRSIKEFSIRKSKVLSVGASSLKWSKSIERRSRKANEEATLAVAEAERKKRERNDTVSGTGKRPHSYHKVIHGTELWPGERIFRIGSVHYKMDSSRRSLQRISENKSSCSAGYLSENSTIKSYVPRRLVIGNDEYVRIGNGNQLVRDPKKRTRVLASEKVWWSLHTARLRLVKKRKYCQFFTRFGKCNKDEGKCPYIHDPSKIAVCTKFLKGLCSNTNCKLTHKVIPDRMPDCSYFLQGICTNENCPYRHVHVNPNASTCEGFLRGYCADGNECRKKHSYVCPDFEATGSCSEGSKCKLHHPKKRSKAKKSNRSTIEHKNVHGRYFGFDISEPKRVVSERHQTLDDDDNDGNFFDGKFSDFISLDVSDDEPGELHQVMCDQTTFGDNDYSDLQLDDLDELIKPIRIMKDDSIISG